MLSNSIKTKLLKTFNLNKNKQTILNSEESDLQSEESDLQLEESDLQLEESNLQLEESNLQLEESESMDDLKLRGKNYMHYADDLNKTIPNKDYDNVHVCVYKINTQEMHPFIMFLLYKDEHNNLNFPRMDSPNANMGLTAFETGGDDPRNKNMGLTAFETGGDDPRFKKLFEELEISIEYKGFIEDDNNLMIILKHDAKTEDNNITAVATPSIKQMTYNSKWWWALASEIINYKTILNFKIDNFATKYLIEHSKLMFLYDSKGSIYETPEIGYYGNYYKKIAAVASLGLSRQSPYSSFGPFYYFSDYTHAMRNAFWTLGFKPKEIGASAGTSASETGASETGKKYITVDDKGRYEKGGIVKFALFAGKTKMLMGREFDAIDESSISTDLAEKNDFVKEMLKLRDSSAKWTKEYNSIRIGSHDIKLPGKPDIHTNPMIALKEYEQQVPLEYYFVDTSQNVDEANVNIAVIS